MRLDFARRLRCPACAGGLELRTYTDAASPLSTATDGIVEGLLSCGCSRAYPVIRGVPRLLPSDLAGALSAEHASFYARHPELAPPASAETRKHSVSTQQAFGDEWVRFPQILAEHEKIFRWYFEGPTPVSWRGLRVLDAGCGMGRWLHFVSREGADVVAMDVSRAIDVVAGRESVDCVQADLRYPPFSPGSFDLVYSLGVLHHLEDPTNGLRALAALVRPGGELRVYVYRSLADDPWPRRALLWLVTQIRRITTHLPYSAVHAVATAIAVGATFMFLWPRRLARKLGIAEGLTSRLPLVQYTDVSFRMLVAEQFDRLVAPIEKRYTAQDIEAWFAAIGFDLVALLPGLGWRAIGRRPEAEQALVQPSL